MALPSGQVDQVDNGGLGRLLPGGVLGLLHELDADDGVGAGRRGVHVGGRHSPVSGPLLCLVLNLLVAAHGGEDQTLGCKGRVSGY